MLRSVLRLVANSRVGINLTIPRLYTVRRPVRILGDEEETPLTEEFSDYPRHNRKKSKLTDVYRKSKYDGRFYIKSQVTEEPMQPDSELDFNDYPRPPWIELSDDYELSKFMMIAKSRHQRRKENLTLLEGKRLIKDALLAGVELKALFVSKRTDIESLPLPAMGYKLYWIPYKYISKWTDTTTPSGILAIAKLKSLKETLPDPKSLPLTVVCDGIRDPGNMGAILRVLAAVGCSKVLILKGCVDLWEPKVLRAAAGGHFRVPIEYDVEWEYVNSLLVDTPEETTSVFLADSANVSGKDDTNTKSSNSEGDDSSDSDAENASLQEETTQETVNERETTRETVNESAKDCEVLQASPFYDLQFNKSGKNFLIISNESFGPSKKAIAFTSQRKGVKVHIPLCGNVESLNVVSALSVIAFEMRRQMSVS